MMLFYEFTMHIVIFALKNDCIEAKRAKVMSQMAEMDSYIFAI